MAANSLEMSRTTDIQTHIEHLFIKLGITDSGKVLIQGGMSGIPARQVQGRLGNVITRFQSKKMGRAFLLESRRGEWAQAVLFENDPDVLAYYPQPFTVDAQPKDRSGKPVGRWQYTPDFLVIRKSGLEVVEVRDETRLLSEAIRSGSYTKDQDGSWHYQPAEIYFSERAIPYRVISTLGIPATLVVNSRFLEDYLRPDCPLPEPEAIQRLSHILEAQGTASFDWLVGEHQFDSDTLFKAIAAGDIYVDLNRDRLDVSNDLMLSFDQAANDMYRLATRCNVEAPLPVPGSMHIASGTEVKLEGKKFHVVLCGERDATLQDEDGYQRSIPIALLGQSHQAKQLESDSVEKRLPLTQVMARYHQKDVKRGIARLDILKRRDLSAVSASTLARYASATALASNDYEAAIALIGSQSLRGNRSNRLPVIVEEIAAQAIRQRFNRAEKSNKKGAYATHVRLCSEEAERSKTEVIPMSYPTFCKRCDELEDVRKREGKRSAYQKRPIPQFLDQSLPVHGTRPHEVCSIDHTVAVMATISPQGVELGKPYFTLAADCNTTHPRAFILSYNPPSAATVLMVLRDYVRRHKKLPRVILVDNGKEFHSKELELFCSLYNIEIRYRPPGMPRGAANIERALGATEQEVFAQMQGNTRQMRDPRLITKSVNPFLQAIWTLPALWNSLDEYLFQVRPKRQHPALGMTPDEFEAKRIGETGTREHTLIRFDDDIMLMTCPHSKIPMHRVDRRRGIWTTGMYYWHPDMASVPKGTKVEVRNEPWIANVIYAKINNRWVTGLARNLRPYAGRTCRAVEIALREEQRIAKLTANKDTVCAKQLKKMERLWDPTLFDARIGAQQNEMLYQYSSIGMGVARSDDCGITIESNPWNLNEAADLLPADLPDSVAETASQSAPSLEPRTAVVVHQTAGVKSPTLVNAALLDDDNELL